MLPEKIECAKGKGKKPFVKWGDIPFSPSGVPTGAEKSWQIGLALIRGQQWWNSHQQRRHIPVGK